MGKSMVSCKFSLKPIHWIVGRDHFSVDVELAVFACSEVGEISCGTATLAAMFVTCSRGLIDADGWWIFSCGLPSVAGCKLGKSHMLVGRWRAWTMIPDFFYLGKTMKSLACCWQRSSGSSSFIHVYPVLETWNTTMPSCSSVIYYMETIILVINHDMDTTLNHH